MSSGSGQNPGPGSKPGPAVLVTGASTGIGRDSALHLEGLGFRVFAGVRRDEDARELTSEDSPGLTPVILDVTDEAGIRRVAAQLEGELGETGLQGLVNNAGICVPGPLEELPIDELRRQLDVNVVGQIAVTQACLPLLRHARGRVVNIGSIAGQIAYPFIGAYAASKFALEAVSDVLRLELHPWGIFVSIIEPGSVATPIWRKSHEIEEGIRGRNVHTPGLYDEFRETMRDATRRAGHSGFDPVHVSRVIHRALTARRPRARYVVGRDAKIQLLLSRLLPTALRDRMFTTRLGLGAAPGGRSEVAGARSHG